MNGLKAELIDLPCKHGEDAPTYLALKVSHSTLKFPVVLKVPTSIYEKDNKNVEYVLSLLACAANK